MVQLINIKKINDVWFSEMIWKNYEQIKREMSERKEYLETILNCEINIFVAPNNSINSKGIIALENLGMNYSGIIQHKDRPVNYKYKKKLFS